MKKRVNREKAKEKAKLKPIVKKLKKNISKSIHKMPKISPKIEKEIRKIRPVNIPNLKSSISKSEVLDSYEINMDNTKVGVKILMTEEGKKYELDIPKISVATEALIDSLRQKIVESPEISIEATEQVALDAARKKIYEKASSLLESYKLDEKAKNTIIAVLINEMLGLGNIDILVNDLQLEEIVINDKEKIKVYHKSHGWLSTNFSIGSDKQIENYASIIARRVGRQITNLSPMLDAHLLTGDRVNAVLTPISTKGNTITIRKFARDPWTAVDFIKNGTCSSEVFAILWTAMQYELNILFSGGTASGKTSMLNVCMPFIPPNHRIISIEDTRELQLPENLYWTPLITRLPNPEGKGAVTMLDLLVNSLRMRPDRIILGEMRKADEAEVLFEAMHTGHSVYATVHADSATETISRLINPPLNVPPNLLKTVDLCLVMFRDRKRSIRRVYQLAEFIGEEGTEKASVKSNILYRWDNVSDKIIKHMDSQIFLENLSRNTGLNANEINKEFALKKQILDYMVKNNMRSMAEISKITQQYYIDPESVKKMLR